MIKMMMEYMALGKPIVAFDLPEHRFSAQKAAVYAQPNSESDFTRKLSALMDDPALRTEMGEAGRDRVDREFAWRHQAPHLVAVYDALTGQEASRVSSEKRMAKNLHE